MSTTPIIAPESFAARQPLGIDQNDALRALQFASERAIVESAIAMAGRHWMSEAQSLGTLVARRLGLFWVDSPPPSGPHPRYPAAGVLVVQRRPLRFAVLMLVATSRTDRQVLTRSSIPWERLISPSPLSHQTAESLASALAGAGSASQASE